MDITLRKAKQIQTQIRQAIDTTSVSANVQITEYDDPLKVIEETRAKMITGLDTRALLIGALYEIRGLVKAKNSSAGIDKRLGQIAQLQELQDLYNSASSQGIGRPLAEVTGMHEKLKSMPSVDTYGRMNQQALNVSVMDEDASEKLKANAKACQAKKVAVQDEILELNLKSKIKLSEETTTLLKDAGVL